MFRRSSWAHEVGQDYSEILTTIKYVNIQYLLKSIFHMYFSNF